MKSSLRLALAAPQGHLSSASVTVGRPCSHRRYALSHIRQLRISAHRLFAAGDVIAGRGQYYIPMKARNCPGAASSAVSPWVGRRQLAGGITWPPHPPASLQGRH